MSGTVSCNAIVTSSVSNASGASDLQIGSFSWPSDPPSTGQVLSTDGSGNLSFSSQNSRAVVDSASTVYSIDSTSDIVAITGALDTTLTLPDPSTKTVGDLIYVVKEVSGTSVVTIVPFGSELISGNSSTTLVNSFGSVKIYTNGTNWFALF